MKIEREIDVVAKMTFSGNELLLVLEQLETAISGWAAYYCESPDDDFCELLSFKKMLEEI